MLHNQNKIYGNGKNKRRRRTNKRGTKHGSKHRERSRRTHTSHLTAVAAAAHIGISAAGLLLLSSSSVTFSWYLSFFVALVASNTRARIFKNSTSETTRAGQWTASSGHISRGGIPSLPAAAVARLLYLYLRENSGAHTVHHSSLRSIYRPAGN